MVGVVYPLENNILEIVKLVERQCKYGVLPKNVQARLHLRIAEQTVRRYMVRMWESGRLFRIGGIGARRGYRTLSGVEAALEREVVGILRGYPFGASVGDIVKPSPPSPLSQFASQERGDNRFEVVGYLRNMAARGVLIEVRDGIFRLPNLVERVAWDVMGSFPYLVA